MTQLTLGVDRDAGGAIAATFDERDDAVKAMLAHGDRRVPQARQLCRHLRAGTVGSSRSRAVAGGAGDREHVAQSRYRRRDVAGARQATSRPSNVRASSVWPRRATPMLRRNRGHAQPAARPSTLRPSALRACRPHRAIGVATLATLVRRLAADRRHGCTPSLCAGRARVVAGIVPCGAAFESARSAPIACRRLRARSSRGRASRRRPPIAGHCATRHYVGGSLTSIVWRRAGARRSRAIAILPDMLPAEDFRRLRVLLRYARSDARQGAPVSQA